MLNFLFFSLLGVDEWGPSSVRGVVGVLVVSGCGGTAVEGCGRDDSQTIGIGSLFGAWSRFCLLCESRAFRIPGCRPGFIASLHVVVPDDFQQTERRLQRKIDDVCLRYESLVMEAHGKRRIWLQ